jgi:hypothetical protein
MSRQMGTEDAAMIIGDFKRHPGGVIPESGWVLTAKREILPKPAAEILLTQFVQTQRRNSPR